MGYFEYGKNNDRYLKKKHLIKQVVEKVLPIAKALYPRYQLLFLYDNATCYLVFILDVLQVDEINKKSRSQQNFFKIGGILTVKKHLFYKRCCF